MSDFVTRTCTDCSGDGQYQPPHSNYQEGSWDLTCTACNGTGKRRVRVQKTLDVHQWNKLERFLLEQHRNTFLDLLDRNTSVNRQVFHKAREACLAAAIPEARLAHREQQIKQRLQENRNPTNPTPELVEQWR